MTDDLPSEVMARIAAGASFSAIGAALGLTKGQVAGLCHRERRRLTHIAAMPKPAPAPRLAYKPQRPPPPPAPPPLAPSAGCQFPYGDPKDRKGFRFCGAPVAAPGASYCGACYRRAYVRRAA